MFEHIEKNLDNKANRRVTQGNVIVKTDHRPIPNPQLKDTRHLYDFTKSNFQDLQRQKQINSSQKNEFVLGFSKDQFPSKPPPPSYQPLQKPIVRNQSCVSLG